MDQSPVRHIPDTAVWRLVEVSHRILTAHLRDARERFPQMEKHLRHQWTKRHGDTAWIELVDEDFIELSRVLLPFCGNPASGPAAASPCPPSVLAEGSNQP